MLEPTIVRLVEKKLIGFQVEMSFENNQTAGLWRKFMPAKRLIKNAVNQDLYSLEIYPSTDFFSAFNPATPFQKWAAIEVRDFESVPPEMEQLIIPEGDYAVFNYRGAARNAFPFYQQIFTNWLPNSEFQLAHRPHFALMGAAYKNDSHDSEETIWIPIGSTKNAVHS